MGFEEFFCQRQLRNVNTYNKYNHFSCTTVQFVSIVTNFLAFIFSISTAVLVYVKRDTFPDITYIGVALNYSFLVPYFLVMFSIVATYLATTATCLERILDFVVGDHAVPQEPPWTLPTDPDPDTWPAKGDLEFENVCLRYRPGLPLALDDVSFRAEHGENVGVVGRTGAGKSSLVASLFRIVDAESGVVRLDGVDLRRVGAHAARRAVAVVPQTPLLIPGTVGHNLDPFGVETRERMEAALHRVGLDDPDALDARAERDLFERLGELGRDRMVVFISHRFATVRRADQIIVLLDGRVAEHGKHDDLVELGGVYSELYAMQAEQFS